MRFRVALLIMSLNMPGLVACGTISQPGGGALVIVAGGRSNMPTPKLTGEARTWVEEAVDRRDMLFIVGVSGHPRVVHQEQITTRCDSNQACTSFREDYLAKTDVRLAKVKADSEEADTLGAIIEAGRQMQNTTGPKRIVVIDSGLQTTGHLELQAPGAFAADVDTIVQPLADNRGFKALADTRILLVGLGSYAQPQPQLSSARQDLLEALWERLLTKAGADVTVGTATLRGESASGLPTVTVVKEEPPRVFTVKDCFRIREDQVGFVANRATLRDPEAARKVLAPIADELKKSTVVVTVIGTTALPDNPPDLLSERRAKAVIDVLVEMGVKRSLLHPIGVGINFAGYVPPYNKDGSFNETLAVQNRLVIIQPAGAKC